MISRIMMGFKEDDMHYMSKWEMARRNRKDAVNDYKDTPPIDPGELCMDCEMRGDGVYESCREPCKKYSEAGRKFDAVEKSKIDPS